MWRLELTDTPGVFRLAITGKSSGNLYLTVPPNAGSGSKPTLESLLSKVAEPRQLWRLVPSNDGANSMVQNYSVESGGGLVLDTDDGNTVGQIIQMWKRLDNDNQKWYIERAGQ